ncbi:MAG: flagellar assembly protein FliH [Pseudomonadota bacterium]
MSTSDSQDTRWEAPHFPPPESIPTAGELEALQQQIYDETYKQAWSEGHDAGFAKGLADGSDELAQRLTLLRNSLAAIAGPLDSLGDELETQLLQMVSRLVGRLFRRQLELDPDSIIGLVRDAVARLPAASRDIQVHVHPDDVERLTALISSGDGADSERWSLVADAALTRGGCHIHSASSEIDARVETRIERMVNDLVGDQRSE